MNKETLLIRVAVHPIKAALWKRRKEIKPNMSLREIGNLVGSRSPQMTKHHLDAMVRMGTIDYVGGQYIFHK